MPKGPTKRRTQTRARLLEAAAELFAERGFAAPSIEDICDAAGYTRGAFYSNFTSKDELFETLWDERQREQLAEARTAFATANPDDLVASIARRSAAPGARQWFLISTEFTLYAIRNPDAAKRLAEREAALRDDVADILRLLCARTGRRPTTDLGDLARLVIAIIDGARTQSHLEPDALPPGTLEGRCLGPAILGCTEPDPAASTA